MKAHNPPRTDCLYLTLIRCTLSVYNKSRYWPSLAKSRPSLAADNEGAVIIDSRAAGSFPIVSEVLILASSCSRKRSTLVWFHRQSLGYPSVPQHRKLSPHSEHRTLFEL